MTKREQLVAERKQAIEAAKAIAAKAQEEKRDLTDEEVETVEASTAKAAELQTQIEAEDKRIEKQNAAMAALQAQSEWDTAPAARVTTPVNPDPNASKPNLVGGEGSDKFASFGEYIHNVRLAATDPRVNGEFTRRLQAASGLNTVVDSEGGFLIAPQFATEIQAKMYERGAILGRCRRIPLTGNTYKMPFVNETSRADGSRWGGVRAYWSNEGGTATATKPGFDQLTLHLEKLMCIGYITDEQAEDYGATGSILMDAFTDELTFAAENAIFRGTGAGQPLGVLNAACLVTVDKETNQTAGTIWGSNVTKMYSRCFARSRSNAAWFYNQDCETQLMSLVLEGRFGSASTSAEALPLFMPAGSLLNSGEYGRLMGRDAIPVEYASTVGTVGDLVLADFSQYILADKGGIQTAESMHVRFLYGENTFRASYRLDGAPWWKSALTPYQGSNTLSPFVALASRD
jgi:HK97 family phage major capsid protein